MRRSRSQGLERGLERLEAFTDAALAIAITLLIIELRAPHAQPGETEFDLWAALGEMWPEYLGFGFSALVIGAYWLRHHFMGRIYAKTDHVFGLINIVFMLSVASIPFPVRVFVANIHDPAARGPAATLLTFLLAVAALAWLAKWLYGARDHRLLDPRLDPEFVHRLSLQFVLVATLFVLAAIVSIWFPLIGLGMAAALAASHLFPPPAPPLAQGDEQQ